MDSTPLPVAAVLAQVSEPDRSLSTDLRWLRFPEGTTDTITTFFAVLVAVVLSVIVTLLIQSWVQALLGRLPRGVRKARAEQLARLEPELRAALEVLAAGRGAKKLVDLMHDTGRLEQAISRHVAAAPPQEDLSVFTRLRRRLGLTAMNPAVKVTSTRQLLPDLIVRLVAAAGAERLDLYCPILDVSERHLLIDVPYRSEIFGVLAQHPDVFLLYWREYDGETAFRVRLVPIHSGHISAVRCEHALRTEDSAGRHDFRLTVDLPVSYQFVDRQSLVHHQPAAHDVVPVRGDARLVDLSDGGAALLCDRPLSERGFAQVHFTLRDAQLRGRAIQERPVRVMMEVLTHSPAPDGKTLVRGHFRGASPEARGLIHTFLTHEQFKRIQMREQVTVKAGGQKPVVPPGETPTAAGIAGAGAKQALPQGRPVK